MLLMLNDESKICNCIFTNVTEFFFHSYVKRKIIYNRKQSEIRYISKSLCFFLSSEMIFTLYSMCFRSFFQCICITFFYKGEKSLSEKATTNNSSKKQLGITWVSVYILWVYSVFTSYIFFLIKYIFFSSTEDWTKAQQHFTSELHPQHIYFFIWRQGLAKLLRLTSNFESSCPSFLNC